MKRGGAVNLFDSTNAGATQLKTLFPGALTFSWVDEVGKARTDIPPALSGQEAAILSGANVVGGIIAPAQDWSAFLLDFIATGAGGNQPVIEIGKIFASGAMAEILATATLNAAATAVSFANVDPFTGFATAGVTWTRIFDTVTFGASKGQLGQVLQNMGGAADTPIQLVVDATEAVYYYVIITTLAVTRLRCDMTPQFNQFTLGVS
jgi:hypothetical protein